MPRLKSHHSSSIRKSSRPSRPRDKSPENETPRGQKKRPISNETILNGIIGPRVKKNRENDKDAFCWICHHLCDDDNFCVSCCRVYHSECLNANNTFNGNQCQECKLSLLDGTKLPTTLTPDKLNDLLYHVYKKIRDEEEHTCPKEEALLTWPDEPVFTDKLFNVMDLDILEDNLNESDIGYKSTGQFYSDVKWIYHNCVIVYGANHPKTKRSIRILKKFKIELLDIEACYRCYERAMQNKDDFFTVVCEEDHKLIWAKIKGFPYWPSKCLKVIDGVADVRFFASHDKARVQVETCYELSQENPSGKNPKHIKYITALNELKIYLNNWKSKHGIIYNYSSPKMKFDASEIGFITKGKKIASLAKDAKKKKKRNYDATEQHSFIDVDPNDTNCIDVSDNEDSINCFSNDVETSKDNHPYDDFSDRRTQEYADNDSTTNLSKDNSLAENVQTHTSSTSNFNPMIKAIGMAPNSIPSMESMQTENSIPLPRQESLNANLQSTQNSRESIEDNFNSSQGCLINPTLQSHEPLSHYSYQHPTSSSSNIPIIMQSNNINVSTSHSFPRPELLNVHIPCCQANIDCSLYSSPPQNSSIYLTNPSLQSRGPINDYLCHSTFGPPNAPLINNIDVNVSTSHNNNISILPSNMAHSSNAREYIDSLFSNFFIRSYMSTLSFSSRLCSDLKKFIPEMVPKPNEQSSSHEDEEEKKNNKEMNNKIDSNKNVVPEDQPSTSYENLHSDLDNKNMQEKLNVINNIHYKGEMNNKIDANKNVVQEEQSSTSYENMPSDLNDNKNVQGKFYINNSTQCNGEMISKTNTNKNLVQGEQPSTSQENSPNDFKDKNLNENRTVTNNPDILVNNDTSEKNMPYNELEMKDKKIEELLKKIEEYKEIIHNQNKKIENLEKKCENEENLTNHIREDEGASSSHSQENQSEKGGDSK